MQQVMTDTNKVLIDAKNNGNLMYLPLDKLIQQKPATNELEAKPQQNVNSSSVSTTRANEPLSGRPSRDDRTRQGRE
jgi:membrane protease subunit HflK